MSVKLRELIRLVRQCKTAAEERKVVAKESAALRDVFNKQDTTYQHRNVAKLMYIHMLGYPTHFGQMECLKLIAAPSFSEKRIGYLGLMILLDERQEVLMLVTNSLKNDLNNDDQNIVGLALVAMGNICSAEMARDLSPDVEQQLRKGSSYIKKKAGLCAIRILKKVPELVESYREISVQLLSDRQHGVLLSGITLISEICHFDSSSLTEYRRHVPQLCRILRSLVVSGYSPEHDVGGINDPFLQVKILRLLRVLGYQNSEASDEMSDILAQVATNTESVRTTGNSILYECVQTIMNVESTSGLRVLGINILGRFLSNKDNNIRYVALNTLTKVVAVDAQAVQRHRDTIVECVKDADVSIRKIALELVYSLVNESNIKALTKELLEYLAISDSEFKPDLTSKICVLIQKFSPDTRWHVDSMVKILIQAGQYVKPEICRSFIVLVTNATDLQAYAVRALYTALEQNVQFGHSSLITISCWCMGEYGEYLLSGAQLQEDETPVRVGEADVVDLLEGVLQQLYDDVTVKEYGVTALMKLSPKLESEKERIKAILERYQSDLIVEIQQRCCEYTKIMVYEQLCPQLFERMPPLDMSKYVASNDVEVVLPSENGTAENGNRPNMPPTEDLLQMDGIFNTEPTSGQADAAMDILGDLMQPLPETSQTAPVPSPVDLLDMLTAEPSEPQQSAPAVPSMVVYENYGIKGTFELRKPSTDPSQTEITATYTTTAGTVAEFSVQVAVPKYMTLKLSPVSSNLLTAATPITQKIEVTNSQHGQKALAMRLKIAGRSGDQVIADMAEVRNFPSDV